MTGKAMSSRQQRSIERDEHLLIVYV